MPNPALHRLIAEARVQDLHRAASRRRLRRRVSSSPPPLPADTAVTLRYAFPDDAEALARLAALDSALLPDAPVLVAEIGGELRAALSLADGRTIADPFHRSDWVLALLRQRAAQLAGPHRPPRRAGVRARLRPRAVGQRTGS